MGMTNRAGSLLGLAQHNNGYGGELPKGTSSAIDVHYKSGDRLLDLVKSRETPDPLPVIIYFGSGSFFKDGHKEYLGLCTFMAKRGYAVVDPMFQPISGKAGLKGSIDDLVAVLKWMEDNARNHRLDLDRVYVTGSSYGALAAVWTALLCDTGRLRNVANAEDITFKVNGLGLFNGRTDTESGDKKMRRIAHAIRTLGKKKPDLAECLRPWDNHDLRTMPPVFQTTGENDAARADTYRLDLLLDTNAVAHDTLDFGPDPTVLEGFMESSPDCSECSRTLSKMLDFFGDR